MSIRTFTHVAVASLLLAGTVQAQSISLNTGMSGTTAIAAGSTDPNWTISTNGTTFAAAVVAHPINQCCDMTSVNSAAQWITDQSTADSPNTGWGVGNTVYARRTFDLTAFALSGTSLNMTWRVADDLVGIWLNGTQIQGPVASTWFTDRTLTVSAGSPLWILGVNTLEFRATSQNSTWDGFYVNGSVTGPQVDGVVPEPSTYVLMGTGVIGLLILRRRRTRAEA